MRLYIFILTCSLFILSGCSNKEFEQFIISGTQALEAGEFNEAKQFFEQASTEDSEDITVKHTLNLLKKYDDLLTLYNKEEWETLSKEAENFLLQKNLPEKLISAVHIFKRDSLTHLENQKDISFLISKANYANKTDNFEQALSLLEAIESNAAFQEDIMPYKNEINSIKTDATNKLQKKNLLSQQAKVEEKKNQSTITNGKDAANHLLNFLRPKYSSMKLDVEDTTSTIMIGNEKCFFFYVVILEDTHTTRLDSVYAVNEDGIIYSAPIDVDTEWVPLNE